MPASPFLMLLVTILLTGCGGDKHLPSSNPPEYDPSKVYTTQTGIPERGSGISPTQAPPYRPVTEPPRLQPAEARTQRQEAQPRPAAELVRRVLTGGADGQAALLEALSASGFAVMDSKRRVVSSIPQKPEMGVPLEDWEVRLLARAAAEQITMPFGEFETDVALAVGHEQDGRLLITMLLNDIRTGITDARPTVRTWASLIVELGRQSAIPYDLRTATDFTSVHLNGLQQVLILKHLSAEFFALGIQRATASSMSHGSLRFLDEGGAVHLVANTQRVSSLQPGDPCGFGTDQGTATSESASIWGAGLKLAFGPLRQAAEETALLELYKRLGDVADKRSTDAFVERMKTLREIDYSKAETAQLNKLMKTLSKLHSLATALLSLAELTAVMNAVKIDISMEPAPPLERTKTRQPGQYAKLAAALSFDLSKLDLPKQLDLHCAGVFFMGLGLDFSMPENGPIKNADVEWTLVKGGLKMDAKAGNKITEAIVELENPGPRIQDAGVGFDDVKKSVRTNENGVVKVGIHGAPQKRDLGRDPQPVIKEAIVRANVQLKPADMFRDLADALKGPWTLPAQVLYRSHLLGRNYKFDVIDWLPPIRLLIQHRIQADPQSAKSKMGMAQFDGAVQFEIPLEPYAEDWVRGEINIVRPMVVRYVRPAPHACSGSGSEVEHWLVTAHVDPKSESMTVQFGYVTSSEQASWTCTGPSGTFTNALYVDLFGNLESVNMATMTGTKKDVTGRDTEFHEWLSVTVVEGLN